jgi:fibronectin-binding autotransporter adhesin
MDRRFFGRLLCACVAYLAACVSIRAQDVWTSYNIDNSWTNNFNWQSGSVPANPVLPVPGTADILFASSLYRTDVLLNASQNINTLTIAGVVTGNYDFKAASSVTLTIQSGVTFLPCDSRRLFFSNLVGIALGAGSQPWTVSSESSIEVAGVVSGSGGIILGGVGDVLLRNANTFTGGVTLAQGRLIFGNDSALGTGTLTLAGGTLVPDGGPRTIGNPITVFANSTVDTSRGPLTASGNVTLANSASLTVNGWTPVTLSGAIIGSSGTQVLTKEGTGALIIAGAVSNISGAVVNNGQLYFASTSAVPNTGTLTVTSNGYIGTGLTTGVQSGFIGRIAVGSTGAFGFDTSNLLSPAIVTDAIDLTGFNSAARLGSGTAATLSGTITPQGTSYNFGSGGGLLYVQSGLTEVNTNSARSVSVDSAPGQPLTLVLSGTNTYTGVTTVNSSLLRFSSPAAFSPLNTNSILLSGGSYLGFDYGNSLDLSISSPGSFLGNLAPRISGGSAFILGFDLASISTAVDLSAFSGKSVYLGSSTTTTLSGPITPAGSSWRFASVKGGQLTIASTLGGTSGVEIGSYNLVGSGFGVSSSGFVALTGNNTYSGNTTLYNGRLVLGNANALGTGNLTVSANNPGDAFLEASSPGLAIGNSINLSGEGSVTLNVGGSNSFTLGGNITGNGGLNKYGTETLTLNGANTFKFVAIDQGTVAFGTDSSIPSELLKIGEAATASFLSSAPTINGLEGDPGAFVNVSSNTTLTINVPSTNDRFAGAIQGSGGLVIAGCGRLELGASPDETLHDGITTPPASNFTGGTTINGVNGGSVELHNNSALGTGNVTIINGGQLNLNIGVTLTNPITFTSGTIGGFGTFAPTGGITIGSCNTLAPGMNNAAVGYLNFASNLTLASGGTYEWNIAYAGGVNGPAHDGIVWDQVNVVSGNLNITATPGSPFNVKLATTDLSGTLTPLPAFDYNSVHSWTIATIAPVNSTGLFTNFNAADFTIDATNFKNSLGAGTFFMSQSGNSLMLNFTPVPEPSTWALLLCGAGAVLLPALRRRRK